MVESEVIGKTTSIKLTNLHMLKREGAILKSLQQKLSNVC